jgi:hypothetical protein
VPVKINPHKLRGPWTDGYALDVHTTNSTMVGHNAYGRAVFDTVRSPLGESLYRLNNRGDKTALAELIDTAGAFVKSWGVQVEALVPVPPSNTTRRHRSLKTFLITRSAQRYLETPFPSMPPGRKVSIYSSSMTFTGQAPR